jgi:hypothetical protein
MPVEEQPQRVSRVGTARALVLLGSALQLAAAAVACFLMLVFGPALLHRPAITGPIVLAVVAFVAITLVDIALANLFALRAGSVGRVVGAGCGTLLAGAVVGVAALLVIATR